MPLGPTTPETTADNVRIRVRRILVEKLNVDPKRLIPGAAIPSLALDSIETLELTMALEDEFDLEFPDHVLDQLLTVEDVTAYLASRLGV